MARSSSLEVTGWTGWVYFAGILMVIMGILSAVQGLTALLRGSFYTAHQGTLIVFNMTTWGWVHLILGIVVLMAGSAVMNGRTWGRVIGILLAGFSLIANFAFFASYPFWTGTVMIVDILIIYSLAVHGAETLIVE